MQVNMHLTDEMSAEGGERDSAELRKTVCWFTIRDGAGGEIDLFPSSPHQLEEIAHAMLAQAQDWRVREGGSKQFGKALAEMNSPHENSAGPDVPTPE